MAAAYARLFVICVATINLVACGGNLEQSLDDVLPSKEPVYKTSRTLPPLEIPPDLASASIQDSLLLPGEAATGSGKLSDLNNQSVSQTGTSSVLPVLDDVRVERSGDKRWLVFNANADEVWPQVREFWLDTGILLKREDPSIGIMETDWAENRADIPQGFIRNFLERITTKLYSAATRDKFRVRLERGEDGQTTELYLSHRGAEEVAQGDGFVWQPRPSDPELEAEMLSRMMIYFGISNQRANTLLADSTDRRGSRKDL